MIIDDNEDFAAVPQCPVCQGTGIEFTREDVPKPEAAVFCKACDAGRKRWESMVKTLQDVDSESDSSDERRQAARAGAPEMYY